MEKISDLTLDRVGQLILESIRSFLQAQPRDVGIEWKFQANAFQETFSVNFFDEITLLLKIFPHKNIIREKIFRIEVYQSHGGEMRGRRIASEEIPKSDTIEEDIRSFVHGILSRAGVGKS